ncbi:MAG: ATP-grasp domain-containing protein [Thermoleophilia bacterium]|nr:ATP-grasp domain-containing protein [Thermoleophilia bacterium]
MRKLLVANRGEIAVRVFRTCARLGIATVAIAAPDERDSFHTRRADEKRAVESYLDPDGLVRAALTSGADAVHPGYGFLAERADFAEAVLAAGLLWIGPPPEAMRLAGDKLEAKRAAARAGVPVLESGEPAEVGFPLIVKAAGGGGGRGMRVVRTEAELEEALAAARREAAAAFGDGRVYCERLLERPAHVEVQLLADRHGTVLALGERDCSIQRRHQKVLEETPSPAVRGALRERLAADARALALAVGYVGAGTAEFLVAGDEHVFIELNARLQVEHPVTELVTGLDLVEQQLRIAAGEALGSAPEPRGHAVEVRLYAEDPLTFLPQAGTAEQLRLPEGIRADVGIEAGDAIPAAYDPMIAKLVAHGATRDEALDALAAALAETRVSGIRTNLPFLRWLVSHPVVRAGPATTAFLDEHPPLSRERRPRRPWDGYWRAGRGPGAPPPPLRPAPAIEAAAHGGGGAAEHSVLAAPMPGTVVSVLVSPGDRVAARQTLVVLEAMKMETPVVSPYDAVVERVHVVAGDRVAAHALLVELEE